MATTTFHSIADQLEGLAHQLRSQADLVGVGREEETVVEASPEEGGVDVSEETPTEPGDGEDEVPSAEEHVDTFTKGKAKK